MQLLQPHPRRTKRAPRQQDNAAGTVMIDIGMCNTHKARSTAAKAVSCWPCFCETDADTVLSHVPCNELHTICFAQQFAERTDHSPKDAPRLFPAAWPRDCCFQHTKDAVWPFAPYQQAGRLPNHPASSRLSWALPQMSPMHPTYPLVRICAVILCSCCPVCNATSLRQEGIGTWSHVPSHVPSGSQHGPPRPATSRRL